MLAPISTAAAAAAVAVAVLLAGAAQRASALNAYGHAYSRPGDFSDGQLQAIAAKFKIFTVEKDTAAAVYGNASAPPRSPFRTNSIAASVGTARKIKAINQSVKVLMYWNAAIHFNFYECESEVQPSWYRPDPAPGKEKTLLWDYTVPEFRDWWVRCAVDAVQKSERMLDGLFIDAIPKVDVVSPSHLALWTGMIDQVRGALGPDAIIIDNGFFLTKGGAHLAGEEAWAHTGVCYTESLASVGTAGSSHADSLQQSAAYLEWVANASRASPNRTLIGHGTLTLNRSRTAVGASGAGTDANGSSVVETHPVANVKLNQLDPVFQFGLAKYLLITSSVKDGWFLANGDYSIDGGLLDQPMEVYTGDGVGCGEPTGHLERVRGKKGEASYQFRREFEHGSVDVDVEKGTSTIACGSA